MAKKLYVGNLSYGTTADSLKAAFSKVGTVVSANVISDKMTGRSRGFGFVEMEDADAEKAVSSMHGTVPCRKSPLAEVAVAADMTEATIAARATRNSR